MKKSIKLSLSALLLSALTVGCQNDDMSDLGAKNGDNTFAIRAAVADTRAAFNDLAFAWKSGDQLLVKTDNETLTLSLSGDSSDQSVGQFEGNPTAPLAGFAYVAHHTTIGEIEFAGNSVAFTQPAEQVQKCAYDTEGANYCDPASLGEYSYMYGKSTSEVSEDAALDVNMQHVMTIVDFTISNLPLDKKIHSLKLTPSYALNGTATVNIENSTVECTNPAVESVEVKLQSGAEAGFVAQDSDRDLVVRMALLPHQIPAAATWTIALGTSATDVDVADAEYTIEKSFAAAAPLEAGVCNGALVDFDDMTLVGGAPVSNDYIDEYGVNRGEGIDINGVIWAPVNCGYQPANEASAGHKGYIYGKLYQWGRKDGLGYIHGASAGSPTHALTDATFAFGADVVEGNIEMPDEGKLYKGWVAPKNTWGNEKTATDPCPEGWRVPSTTELQALLAVKFGSAGPWTFAGGFTVVGGLSGLYYNGTKVPGVDSGVFLPASGWLYPTNGAGASRGFAAQYWANEWRDNVSGGRASSVKVSINISTNIITSTAALSTLATGCSVRCVKE